MLEEACYYSKRDGTKLLSACKDCINNQIDNFAPSSFLWILKICDVPYIPEVWDKLVEKHPPKNGYRILGRYLSMMKLMSYKHYTWEDTSFLINASINKQIERGEIP